MKSGGVHLAMFALLAGCATYTGGYPTFGVRAAIENVDTLRGKRIVVVGLVQECHRLGCALTEERNGKEYRLGLGASPGFDRKMQKWLGRPVAIEADFTARCIDDDPNDRIIVVCTDRATSLENPEIIGSPDILKSGFKP